MPAGIGKPPLDFTLSASQAHWLKRVRDFMDAEVYPAAEGIHAEHQAAGADRWRVLQGLEVLKAKAKAQGLWNLFMPPSAQHDVGDYHGAGLTNLDYALCAQEMGRTAHGAEVFNCSAPDTGNMEVLHYYGSEAQKDRWLKPLMQGEIRSAFLMTEPEVASSDATNITTSIRREGNDYVINGRKWWSSGAARWPSSWARAIRTQSATSSSPRSWCRSTPRAWRSCGCCPCSATTTRLTATLR